MNNQNNTPEAPKTVAPKRKKTFLRSQLWLIITVSVVLVALIAGVIIANTVFKTEEGAIDSITESRTDAEAGKVKYTYYSKKVSDVIVITDEAGTTLKSFYVDANGNETAESAGGTLVYETELGSLLRLTSAGKITYFAKVDFDNSYVGGDAACRVLLFPKVEQNEMKSITVHHSNEDGSITEFVIDGYDLIKYVNGNETSGTDGLIDTFKLRGYEKTTMNPVISVAVASFSGYTLTLKKLSREVMEALDKKKGEDPEYDRLLKADGTINFAEYGLEDGEDAAYYEIETVDGKRYRVYIGSESPDGTGLYIRYYDEREGARNAVYKISNDPGTSAALGIELSRSKFFLGKPEDLIYPQINSPVSLNTSLMPTKFVFLTADPTAPGGYRTVIKYTYVNLDDRNYTLDVKHPYRVDGDSLPEGYYIDDSRINETLQDLYSVSTIMSSGYTTSAVNNYVHTVMLVPDIISDSYKDITVWSEEYIAAIDKAVEENTELSALLERYGLKNPLNKIMYNATTSVNGRWVEYKPNYIWISDVTENDTYYVWAPQYQQIVEVGEQYLNTFRWTKTLDWASKSVFDPNIVYCDSLRFTGTDDKGEYRDILFELKSDVTITYNNDFDFNEAWVSEYSVKPTYKTTIITLADGTRSISLSASFKYSIPATNSQTGEATTSSQTNTYDMIKSLNLNTLKNYCRVEIDADYVNKLSSEEKSAYDNYRKTDSLIKHTVKHDFNGKAESVEVVHRFYNTGDTYGIIPGSYYNMTVIYNVEDETITIRLYRYRVDATGAVVKKDAESTVFNEKTFDNYFRYSVRNNGNIPVLTDNELAAIDTLYHRVNSLTSFQSELRITTFDKNGERLETKVYTGTKAGKTEGDTYISAFKKLYGTLIYAQYGGYASETSTAAGKFLTEEKMQEYRDRGDDCDLRIEMKLNLDGADYIYRMYNYSVTKAFITANNIGEFYINRTRAEKFINDAVRAMNGDTTIDGSITY